MLKYYWIIIAISFLFLPKSMISQQVDWALQLSGPKYTPTSVYTNSLTVDDSGNSYIIGTYFTSLDFYANSDSDSLILNSVGRKDIYFAKINSNGEVIWANNIGGVSDDDGKDITYDKNGNVYITGSFERTVDFDPGDNQYNLTSAGKGDIFIAKYDKNGKFIWANRIGGKNEAPDNIAIDPSDGTFAIDVDEDGNIYIIGGFTGDVDFDPSDEEMILSTDYKGHMFLASYTNQGKLNWANKFGDDRYDFGDYLNAKNGNVYITGGLNLYKYTVEGNLIWERRIDRSNGRAMIKSTDFDKNGNIYITGRFKDEVGLESTDSYINIKSVDDHDSFIVKYDKDGSIIWNKQIVGSSYQVTHSLNINNNNLYLAGRFSGLADFDPGPNNFELFNNASNAALFISKYDLQGNMLWTIGTNENESRVYAKDLVVNKNQEIILSGRIWGTLQFNNKKETSVSSQIDDDIFLIKFKDNITNIETTQNQPLSIHPNPADDRILINLNSIASNIDNIQLTDILGNSYTPEYNLNSREVIVNVADLDTGVYFITLYSNGKVVLQEKLMKK